MATFEILIEVFQHKGYKTKCSAEPLPVNLVSSVAGSWSALCARVYLTVPHWLH